MDAPVPAPASPAADPGPTLETPSPLDPTVPSPEDWAKNSSLSGASVAPDPLPGGWRFYLTFLFQPYRLAHWFATAVDGTEPNSWSLGTLYRGPLNSRAFPMAMLKPLFWRLLLLTCGPLLCLCIVLPLGPWSGSAAFPLPCAMLATLLAFALIGIQRNIHVILIPGTLFTFPVAWWIWHGSSWSSWHPAAAFGMWTAAGLLGALGASKLDAFRAAGCAWGVMAGGIATALSPSIHEHLGWWFGGYFAIGMVSGAGDMASQYGDNESPGAWRRALLCLSSYGLGLWTYRLLSGNPEPPPVATLLMLGFFLGSTRWLDTLAVNLIQVILYLLEWRFGIKTLRYSPNLWHDAHGKTKILSRHLCLASQHDPVFQRVMQASHASTADRFNWLLTMRRMAPDVFVSYNTRDKEMVQKLVQSLESAGVKVWLDSRALGFRKPGWESRLQDGLFFCSLVVICLGPHGFGRWQRQEYEISLKGRGKHQYLPLASLLLPGASAPPPEFGSFHGFDLRESDPDAPDLFGEAAAEIAGQARERRPKAA